MRLAAALSDFWGQRGYLSEGRRWLGETVGPADASATVAASVQVKALVGAARLAIEQAAYDDAETHCAQAIALAKAHSEQRDLIAALNTSG